MTDHWTVTVSARDLYQALTAVAPHMGLEYEKLDRVLLDCRPDPRGQRGERVLLVTATSRYTIAHAIVPVLAYDGPATSGYARGLLAPAEVKERTAHAREVMRTRIGDRTITLLYPRLERVNFPPVYRISAEHVPGRVGPRDATDARTPTLLQGRLLALFAKAAAAYSAPLVIWPHEQPRTGPVTITCADRFLGLLMPWRGGPNDNNLDGPRPVWDELLDAAGGGRDR